MPLVPLSDRTLRSKTPNVAKSFKIACGAPAPKTSLKRGSNPPMVIKSVKPKITPIRKAGGELTYMISGKRLEAGHVSNNYSLHLLYSKDDLVVQ